MRTEQIAWHFTLGSYAPAFSPLPPLALHIHPALGHIRTRSRDWREKMGNHRGTRTKRAARLGTQLANQGSPMTFANFTRPWNRAFCRDNTAATPVRILLSEVFFS